MAAAQQRRSSKRDKKPVLRLIDELSGQQDLEEPVPCKQPKKDKKFYDVEIKEIDAVNKKVKVHFIGWPDKCDEWQSYNENHESGEFPVVKLQKLDPPSKESLLERCREFSSSLHLEIKKKLKADRKEDPEIRIELPIDKDVFEEVFSHLGKSKTKRGRSCTNIENNRELDETLGKRWNVRFRNSNGDFCKVCEGTVNFWLLIRNPLSDFMPIGGKLFPSKIEQKPCLVFTFTRGTGNRRMFE
eukprot:Seg9737.1 transcript_id=Seg9737.1/GoldUCD/mRNA.D3Y31 product="hypothetical protein" protein_id=Seg9737.1/GoldUCD/D3Y31